MAELRDLNPGDVITAEWLNALKALAEGRSQASPGKAAAGEQAAGVARALAAIKPDEWVQCRITRLIAPGGGLVPEWPSNVRYDLIGIGRPGIVLTNQTPVFGRPVKGDEAKIWPAPVGTICYIVRSPAIDNSGAIVAQLVLLDGSEVVARRMCVGPGAVQAPVSAIVRRPIVPKPLLPLPEELARLGVNPGLTGDSGKTTGGGGEAAGAGAGGGGDGGGLTGSGGGDGSI